MHRFRAIVFSCLMSGGLVAGGTFALLAQQPDATAPKSAAKPADKSEKKDEAPEAGKPIVITRQGVRLIPREHYQIPLQLQPAKLARLTASVDGIVREVRAKTGDKVEATAEFARLDNTEQQLLVEKAKAIYRAAQIEAKRAQAAGDKDLVDLAEARVQAAKADLDLASYRLDQTSVRVPFNGELFRVNVVVGQMLRAGEMLATVGDTAQLTVELPVDRKTAVVGQPANFKIEEEDASGKIESILPAEARFEPLRELVGSIATASVVVDNSSGKFKVGQTVYSPIIPRDSVIEIPNSSVSNGAEGSQKVQVVRSNVVRDVKVEVLGGVGTDRSFVSGPFIDRDEVITSVSQELPDGTLLKPHVGPVGDGATGSTTTTIPAPGNRTRLPATKTPEPPAKKGGF
ncbi:MAG: efflux RND transporter periplasmic adaptor subunit [Planctomycetaceae bacterium]